MVRSRQKNGTTTIDERERHLLHEKLDDVLGPDEAATLMAHLPPLGWADVARRSDVDHLGETLAAKFRAELHGHRAELKGDVHGLRGEMHREFGEVRKEIGHVHEAIGQVRKELVGGNRQMVFAIVGSQFTAVSLAFAAMSLAT